MTLVIEPPRVWRRDSKLPHNLRLVDMSGTLKCEHCGLSEAHIIAERLGCIKSLQPKPPQIPKQKRRDGRMKRARRQWA